MGLKFHFFDMIYDIPEKSYESLATTCAFEHDFGL